MNTETLSNLFRLIAYPKGPHEVALARAIIQMTEIAAKEQSPTKQELP